jgi:hypothetical protein
VRGAPALPERPAHDRAVVIVPVAMALFAALPWIDVSDPEGLGFRLRLMAFLPLVIAAAFVAGVALRQVPLRRVPMPVRGALVAGFLVGWIASRPSTSAEGLVDVDPDMRAAILAAQGVVPDGDWIICPQRNLMFMATYETRAQVRLRPETIAPERRWRMLPSRFLHKEVVHALELVRTQRPAGIPCRGPAPARRGRVVLMPEVTWEWLMKQISPRSASSTRAGGPAGISAAARPRKVSAGLDDPPVGGVQIKTVAGSAARPAARRRRGRCDFLGGDVLEADPAGRIPAVEGDVVAGALDAHVLQDAQATAAQGAGQQRARHDLGQGWRRWRRRGHVGGGRARRTRLLGAGGGALGGRRGRAGLAVAVASTGQQADDCDGHARTHPGRKVARNQPRGLTCSAA